MNPRISSQLGRGKGFSEVSLIVSGLTAGVLVLSGLTVPDISHLSVNTGTPVVSVNSINQDLSTSLGPQLRNQVTKIAGTRCSKAGTKRKIAQTSFVCREKGKKLVWVKTQPSPGTLPIAPSPSPVSFAPKSELSPASVLAPAGECKLKATGADWQDGLIRTGFPRMPDASLPSGDVVVQVVPVDYPNLTGQKPLEEVLKPISTGVTDYYKKISGGRLNLVWRLPETPIRMPQQVEHYRLGINERTNGYSFVQDVIDASDQSIDFSGASFLVVLNPETASAGQIGISPAQQMSKAQRFRTNEGEIYRATYTSFVTTGQSGWVIIAHELGHSLGLPDTYRYSGPPSEQQDLAGRFDLMSYSNLGGALELFAWHKWQLDFIGDSQVHCLTNPNVNRFLLSPVSAGSGNPEMLVLPLSETSAIVVESRRKERFDIEASLWPISDGLLVYQVDTTKATGTGPLSVIRKPGSWNPTLLDNLLGVDEQFQAGPFMIKNVENGSWGNVVEVSRS